MKVNYDVTLEDISPKFSTASEIRGIVKEFLASDKDVIEIIDDSHHYADIGSFKSCVEGCLYGPSGEHMASKVNVYKRGNRVFITKSGTKIK
jgi:hypothetical protein